MTMTVQADVEGTEECLVPSCHSWGEAGKNHETPEIRQVLNRPRVERGASQSQVTHVFPLTSVCLSMSLQSFCCTSAAFSVS